MIILTWSVASLLLELTPLYPHQWTQSSLLSPVLSQYYPSSIRAVSQYYSSSIPLRSSLLSPSILSTQPSVATPLTPPSLFNRSGTKADQKSENQLSHQLKYFQVHCSSVTTSSTSPYCHPTTCNGFVLHRDASQPSVVTSLPRTH